MAWKSWVFAPEWTSADKKMDDCECTIVVTLDAFEAGAQKQREISGTGVCDAEGLVGYVERALAPAGTAQVGVE